MKGTYFELVYVPLQQECPVEVEWLDTQDIYQFVKVAHVNVKVCSWHL